MRQTEALAILNAGANVFLTGAPGAGKTYVLNEFIRQARADGAQTHQIPAQTQDSGYGHPRH